MRILTICATLTCFALSKISVAQLNPKLNFGVRGTLNFCTVGSSVSKYNGDGYYSLGLFGAYQLTPSLKIAAEPTFSRYGFRERQIDAQYSYSYIDINLNTYFALFGDDAIQLYLGLRPGMLLQFQGEQLKNGAYESFDVPQDQNKKNQLDFGVNAGVAIRLSPVVSFELGYSGSLTNQTDNSQIKGRPSVVEATLKLNAVDLKKYLDNKDAVIHQQIKQLQKGTVLVMLPTLSSKELSKLSVADQTFAENELRIRNLRVIQEFKKHFSFAPVLFFLDSSANKVSMGVTEGVFVNSNLEPDTTIKLADPSNYIIASFCNDLYGYNQRINYGLFVYDAKMVQLGKPFTVPGQMFGLFTDGDPVNYFRTKRINYSTMPFDRMIKKLNSRLIRYAEFEATN
jgi:opacity protein-like surface antigen